MSESEDHFMIQDSDSSSKSQLLFPVSDNESSDPMDAVVRSDKESAQPQGAESNTNGNNDSELDSSIPDHIILPNDFSRSDDTRLSMSGLEVIARFRHDPNTDHFMPASFAHCSDDLVD